MSGSLSEEHKQKLRDAIRSPKPKRPPEARFAEKVFVRDDGCWIWTASKVTNTGYGQFGHMRAHRASYEFFIGPIPDGHDLHHTCGVKLCVNPDHLEPMTPLEHQPLHPKWSRRERR